MFQNLTGWHAVILLVIILLLFGAPKLPALAKSLGQSMKIFKAEVKTSNPEDDEIRADTASGDLRSSERPSSDLPNQTAADDRTPGSQSQHKP